MNSPMDLMPIIEAAFLPMKCVCTIAPGGSMTIRLSRPTTEAQEFTVTGIDTKSLVTIRDIVVLVLVLVLVLEVKGEMSLLRSASYLYPKGRQA